MIAIDANTLRKILAPITRRVSDLEQLDPGVGILTPPLHAPTHEPTGLDPITILPDHAPTHEPGGIDPITILPDHATTHDEGGTDPLVMDALAAIASLRSLGLGATQAAPGNLSPSADQKAALVGTDGTPSATNEYVTDSDPRLIPPTPVAPIFYNVKDYGAIGDNIVNDKPAIQLAIDAWELTGGILIFPQGVYRCTAQLIFEAVADKAYVIEGFGSTIVSTSGNSDNVIVFDGDETNTLAIHNLKITRDPFATATNVANNGFLIRPMAGVGVGWTGLHLLNVQITGFGAAGFYIMNCRNVLVENCKGSNNKQAGLIIEGGSSIVVLGGDYSYNISDSGGSDYGIAVATGVNDGAAQGILITGVNAHYNGRKGIDAHHARDIRIIGNTCVGNGAYTGASAPSGIFALGSQDNKDVRDVVIAYNVIDMVDAVAAAGYGIQAGMDGNSGENPGGFIIHGNIIKNCHWNTLSGGICINDPGSGTAPRRVIISNNSLYNYAGTTGDGIHMTTPAVLADQMIITGNAFHAIAAVSKAINSIGALNHIITNNLMRFDGAAGWGIHTTGGPALVVNNVIVGTAPTTPYQNNVAAGSTQYGNRINGTIQFDPVCGAFENGLRVVRGLAVVTVPNGTRAGETTITFSHTFAAAPYVLATVQNGSIFAAADLPLSVTVRNVTTTGCTLTVYLAANCAAQRDVDVAVLVIGT